MIIDWRIDVGHLLTMLGMFIAIGVAANRRFYRLEKKLDRAEERMRLMWRWFKKVHKIDEDIVSDTDDFD